jgi:hypothetical protein
MGTAELLPSNKPACKDMRERDYLSAKIMAVTKNEGETF